MSYSVRALARLIYGNFRNFCLAGLLLVGIHGVSFAFVTGSQVAGPYNTIGACIAAQKAWGLKRWPGADARMMSDRIIGFYSSPTSGGLLGSASCTGREEVVPDPQCGKAGDKMPMTDNYKGEVPGYTGGSVCVLGCRAGISMHWTGGGRTFVYGPLYYDGPDATCDGTGTGGGGTDDPPKPKPTDNNCPTGQCPGTVNGVQMCVKCDSGGQGDKPKPPASSPGSGGNDGGGTGGTGDGGKPGGQGGDKGGTTTTRHPDGSTTTTTTTSNTRDKCKDGVCTRTTTTETTTGGKNPDGTDKPSSSTSGRSEETLPEKDFCSKHPDSPMCTENKSEFGGGCANGVSNTQCKGDAIQCAIAQEQAKRWCELLKEQPEAKDYADAKGKPASAPNHGTFNLPTSLDTSSAFGGGQCIRDVSFNLQGKQVVIPLSDMCEYLAWIRYIVLAVGFFIAYRIVSRG